MKKINVFRIFFLIFLCGIIFAGVIKSVKVETNILKAVLPDNAQSEMILNLTNKNSSRVNIIVESNNNDNLQQTIQNISEEIKESQIPFEIFNYKQIFDLYKKHPNNFLSENYRILLKNKNYAEVVQNSKMHLYEPFYSSFALISLNDDPFMLFTDYIFSFSYENKDKVYGTNNKVYSILSYNFRAQAALSPTELNKEVKKLIALEKKFSKDGNKIYLSGAPVHAYYASQNATRDINIISVISTLFIILLITFYFRSIKPIFPVVLSISIAALAGYAVCALAFSSVHILSFVFSTTLIGVCVDYSLHSFAEYRKQSAEDYSHNNVIKSITVSFLTTFCAFGVLIFSKIDLLQQVAVFTITGLLCVYLIAVLLYPLLNGKIINSNSKPKFNFEINKKFSAFIVALAVIVIVIGLPSVKLNNDITSMYSPKGELLEAEKLYSALSQKNTQYLIIKSENNENFQQHIELEEEIINKILSENKEATYEAFSKYLPSVKKQRENSALISALYKNELKNYADFLSNNQQEALLSKTLKFEAINYEPKKDTYLNAFLIMQKSSIIILENASPINPTMYDNCIKILDVKKDLSEIIANCSKKCLYLILPAFLVMFTVLVVIFKPKKALLLIAPSVLGAVLSLSFLGIFQQAINFFHIISIFLIIGFGIDYSVFRFNGSKNSVDAVFISALTTIVAFGLLAFAGFKLVSSMGIVVALGLAFSYLFSLIFIRRDLK